MQNHRETVDQEVDATEISHFAPRPGLRSPGAGGRAILQNIAAFTERKLTHESDILNAFTGILKVYARADPPVYSYWGVPILPSTFRRPGEPPYTLTQGFLSGLCWQSMRPGRRRPGFPSWSWVGWTGTVSSHSREYIVGVKMASQSEIKVSIFYNGRLMSWEEEWNNTFNQDILQKDLPHHLYIEAWTIEVRLVHSSFFSVAEGDGEADSEEGHQFYAYTSGIAPTKSHGAVNLSRDPTDMAGGHYLNLTQETYVGILLGRGDRLCVEMFVLIVRKHGNSYERIGSLQFGIAQWATEDGWFAQKKRQVIKLG